MQRARPLGDRILRPWHDRDAHSSMNAMSQVRQVGGKRALHDATTGAPNTRHVAYIPTPECNAEMLGVRDKCYCAESQ